MRVEFKVITELYQDVTQSGLSYIYIYSKGAIIFELWNQGLAPKEIVKTSNQEIMH